jgi:hypothetical protein
MGTTRTCTSCGGVITGTLDHCPNDGTALFSAEIMSSGTRYVAHGTTYKPRDREASLRFKRARFKSYEMMRVRPQR